MYLSQMIPNFRRGMPLLIGYVLFAMSPLMAQEGFLAKGEVDVDILFNYYDQDGNNSPVTGGIGTEDQQVLSPVFLVGWRLSENWTLRTDLGVDNISSASVDNIDDAVSSASEQDNRTFVNLAATRTLGRHQLRLLGGFSKEYDYDSTMAGIVWSTDFNNRNTNVSASLRFYSDTVELYDIDGVQRGEDDRETMDLTLALTQVLGPRTLFSAELYFSDQSGFLSTPFHEVLLAGGGTATERLPDSRTRQALGLRLNHSFSKRYVQRFYYRFYNDDWGIQAHTVELEPHFRLSAKSKAWIYPILRWHSQNGADHFGLPFTFTGAEDFFTVDRDLSEFTSEKFGLGMSRAFDPAGKRGLRSLLRSFDIRATTYSRDDGLDAFSASLAVGLRI